MYRRNVAHAKVVPADEKKNLEEEGDAGAEQGPPAAKKRNDLDAELGPATKKRVWPKRTVVRPKRYQK